MPPQFGAFHRQRVVLPQVRQLPTGAGKAPARVALKANCMNISAPVARRRWAGARSPARPSMRRGRRAAPQNCAPVARLTFRAGTQGFPLLNQCGHESFHGHGGTGLRQSAPWRADPASPSWPSSHCPTNQRPRNLHCIPRRSRKSRSPPRCPVLQPARHAMNHFSMTCASCIGLDRCRCLRSDFAPQVFSIPRFGCLNVHPSLLPSTAARYIQWAILDGDATGVTIMKDGSARPRHGAVLSQQSTPFMRKTIRRPA